MFKSIIILSFGVQSHHHSQFWRSEPPPSFSVSAFRAIIILSFGIQSYHRLSVSEFKAIIILSFGVQSHHYSQFRSSEPSSFLVSAFRTIIILNFGIQSHHRFLVLAFKVIIAPQFRHLEPPSLLSFGVQSHHHSQFWRSESSSFSVSAFRATIIILSFGI